MSTNAYWLDEKTQLTINKKSVAYGEEIPEDMLRKIDPKSLEIFQKNGQIGSSMPKPGRLPGQAEYMRQIETLEKTVKSQSKQAAQAAGLKEELDATKKTLGEMVKTKDGQMNGLKIENGGLREQIEDKDKEIKTLKKTDADVEQLKETMKVLSGTVDEKVAEIKTLTESNTTANAEIKKLTVDLAKKKG